jgi:hypothetical protein
MSNDNKLWKNAYLARLIDTQSSQAKDYKISIYSLSMSTHHLGVRTNTRLNGPTSQ